MATQVIMPQLGESVVEGTVSFWLKKVGEPIEEFEPLLEVSTDKVTTEIPAPATGVVLEIFVEEDETVDAGTVLAVIGQPNEQPITTPTPQPVHQGKSNGNGNGHHESVPQVRPKAPAAAHNKHLTPVVARMVAEHSLDVSQITGTGHQGRVTKKDVLAYMDGQTGAAPELAAWETPGSGDLFKPTDTLVGNQPPQAAAPVKVVKTPPPSMPAATAPVPAPTPKIADGVPGELRRHSPMRKAIAAHMVQSKLQTAPHVTTVFEADLSAILAHRAAHKAQFAAQGVKLTLTAYFIAAMVDACRAYPIINSQWQDDGVFIHEAVHIGMATAIDGGLVVPVIRNAGDLNLMGLARQINDLASRARKNRLVPDELQGGTITITNHGVSGSLVATPIINQPQSAILGVGAMEKRVKVINDAIAIRPCSYLSLTFDHRVADGATADGWLAHLKNTLESWA